MGPMESSESPDRERALRELLLERRRRLLEASRDHARHLAEANERGTAVEEEEAAAEEHSRFVLLRLKESTDGELRRVEDALRRMDEGLYGVCDDCDEPIAFERLRVMPYSRLCAPDAARREQRQGRRGDRAEPVVVPSTPAPAVTD